MTLTLKKAYAAKMRARPEVKDGPIKQVSKVLVNANPFAALRVNVARCHLAMDLIDVTDGRDLHSGIRKQ